MSRPSPALVVVILALAITTSVGALAQPSADSAAPVVDATTDGPNHLAIGAADVAASNTTTADVDVAMAISADSSELQGAYAAERFETAYASAETDAARARLVENATEWVVERTERLEARNMAISEAFANGSVDADRFLRERARIQTTVEDLQTTINAIESTIPSASGDRLITLRGRLETLQGTLSGAVAEAYVTDGDPMTVYVEVSTDGYTIANVSQVEYTRETFLGGNRDPATVVAFPSNGTSPLQAAEEYVMEQYPWVRIHQTASSVLEPGSAGMYRIQKGFPGGRLYVYVDGATEEIFGEYQRRALDNISTTPAIDRVSGSVRITVNRTYEGGPAELRLRDPTTGVPVSGTVRIGERAPADVGPDGTHWFVEPRGAVDIRVTADSTNTTVTMSGS